MPDEDKHQKQSHERMERSLDSIKQSEQAVARGKQRTEKGLEIPVPKRKDLMDALRRIVKPEKKP